MQLKKVNHWTNIHDKAIGKAVSLTINFDIKPNLAKLEETMIFHKSCVLITRWQYCYQMTSIRNSTGQDTREMAMYLLCHSKLVLPNNTPILFYLSDHGRMQQSTPYKL